MSDYPFERAGEIYPAGTLLQVRVYGLIRHVGLATGYGTVRSKKGQRYNVMVNNCEHFVSWVLTGQRRSRQLGPADARRVMRD